jgi:peptide/nickel transport system permease protein
MARFLLVRVVLGLVVLWIMTLVVFVMFFVAPHNVANLIAGKQATPDTVAAVKARLGLDQPVLTQYGHYVWRLVHGNLGYSFYNSSPVRSLIWSRLPVTFSLALGGAILWLLIGVSAGVLASTRPRTLADRAVTFGALFFYSMPSFLLGVIIFYLFFFRLHLAGLPWFPGNGYVAFSHNPLRWAQHLVLPWFTLALVTAATYARLTRGTMLDVLEEDYIRTARAKGVSERRVIYRHALRGALTPVVTQLGIDFGTLLGGVIVVENIFGLPGLGQMAVQAVLQQDLPVVIGTIIVAATFIVVANILVDITYGLLDPRVRVH